MPRLSPHQFVIALNCVLSLSAQQSRPPIPLSPLNLDFAQGAEGAVPPYWELTQRMRGAGYSAELRHQGCAGNLGCLVLQAPANATGTGLVVNMFDATGYRNLSFQIRALVKQEHRNSHYAPG
jgi:hypothetical protein